MVSQGLLGEMPDVKELENPDIYVASEIISSDGVSLGKFEKGKKLFLLNTRTCRLTLFSHFRQKKMSDSKSTQELI